MSDRAELEALRAEFSSPRPAPQNNDRAELEALRAEFASPQKKESQPSANAQPPTDFSVGEMVSNIPSSAMQFGKDIAQPFIHPVDTARSLGNLAMGMAEKFGPISHMMPKGEHEKYPEAVGKFLVDRYGSIDAAKQTLMRDPVGVAADLSIVLTAGGSAAAQLPGKFGQAGKIVANTGKAIEPLNVAKSGAKVTGQTIGKMLPGSLPNKMYESSAKFSTTLSKPERAQITDTALRHGILPTGKGVQKTYNLMADLHNNIDNLIDTATTQGKTIPKSAVYRHLKGVRKEVGGAKIGAADDLKQVDKVAKSFDEHMKALGKESMTPAELQAFKKDAYKRVNYAAAYGKTEPGRDTATKAMAKAAKESIEDVAPGVKGLNKQYGELVDLVQPLQRSANRIDNRNLIGIDAPIKIVAGAGAGGVPGATMGVLASVIENPKIKARLAQTLYDLQQQKLADALMNKTGKTLTQQGLYQSGRLEDDITSGLR